MGKNFSNSVARWILHKILIKTVFSYKLSLKLDRSKLSIKNCPKICIFYIKDHKRKPNTASSTYALSIDFLCAVFSRVPRL